MKPGIKHLVLSFILLWALSFFTFRAFTDWPTANNIGGSFGAISALFSGLALAMAIYSMLLQQKQANAFEERTRNSEQHMVNVLQQQSLSIGLIEKSLQQQIHAGKVAALTFMIDRQEQRIQNLKDWGRASYKDETHYQRGIDAAKNFIKEYESEIKKLVTLQ
jgi:hypothetical protein